VAAEVPTIIVDTDAPTDAALVDTMGGSRVLVLRPYQSFSNAVTQITRLLPGMHPDRVRALVRTYLPDAKDFDGLESAWRGAVETRVPVVPVEDPHRRRRHLIRKMIAHTAVWSVLTLAAMGYAVSREVEEVPAPYESASFQRFAKLGQLMCDPIDNTHARCVDVDGTVMTSTVLTSPNQTLFSFAYGKENVAMRVLPDEATAKHWVIAGGNHALYDNLTQAGRYVFYGTDATRVRTYAQLVLGSGVGAKAGADRVMGLAIGALNLPDHDRIQLVSVSQESAVLSVMGEKSAKPKVKREVPVTANYLPDPQPTHGRLKHGKPTPPPVELPDPAKAALPAVDDLLSKLPKPGKTDKPKDPRPVVVTPPPSSVTTPVATPTPVQTATPTPTPTAAATPAPSPQPAPDAVEDVAGVVGDLLEPAQP
jgi:hypothetical protein